MDILPGCEKWEFWANYKRYWEILEREFHLEYEEIQALTKFLVEEALKREVTTPNAWDKFGKMIVEEALNRELATPYTNDILLNLVPVEEALKRKL